MTEPDQKAPLFDLVAKRVYIAGNEGMLGAALVRRLKAEGCKILTGPLNPPTNVTRRQDRQFRVVERFPSGAWVARAAIVAMLWQIDSN